MQSSIVYFLYPTFARSPSRWNLLHICRRAPMPVVVCWPPGSGVTRVDLSFNVLAAILWLFSYPVFGVKEALSFTLAPEWKSPREEKRLRPNLTTVALF